MHREKGPPTWKNFLVRWNDFNNIHRIAMEMQPQNASNVTLAFNSYENAFAPTTFTMGISAACCAGISGATVPFVNHNVLLANVKEAGKYIAFAIEWWGNGAQANNNLIQGYWANGIVWGLGGGPWEVRNPVIHGRSVRLLHLQRKRGCNHNPNPEWKLHQHNHHTSNQYRSHHLARGRRDLHRNYGNPRRQWVEPFHLLHDGRQQPDYFFDAIYRSILSERGNHGEDHRHVGSGRKP
jgi:hypothetical protein